MGTENNSALERIVTNFEMASSLPSDLDLESPAMKAVIDAMPEARRGTFLAMYQDPDVRETSVVFNRSSGNYWRSLLTARDEGKKIVFVPFNFAPEIFHALNMVPVCVEVLTTMAQNLEEGVAEYLDLAVERGLPDTMCSTQRGVIGLFEAGILEKPDLLINGALGSCDPNSKAFEYMAEKFDIPALYLDIPYYHDKRALDYYARGFKNAIKAIEEMTGHKLDPDRLREVVDYTNRATELFFEINELKRNVPNPVPNYYNMQHIGTKFMMVGKPEAVEFYEKALEVSKDRLKKGKHVLPEEKIRVLFIYTFFYFDTSIYSWFQEEMGVSYLMDVLSAFDFNPHIDTSSVDTMLYGLAEEMFNLPMTRQLAGSWDMDSNWLWDSLYYAKTYKADCCVFSGHLACKQAWGVYRLVSDSIKKELGIPCLRLEGDGWDSRITPLAVIREQLEEFFETVV
ncbi:MAG: 2-hydroxyacyl-CoA dehydratase [Deltaproteobacteria bacterium]|nr:2-hydroxyacyl-CoA dehydratase [Deltaproteobacteria bacterium]MBW2053210.1 2-hydroxyacyl-CoA dehydratase [Deltaproteobacteria bacterium]MBW2142339.1 2-hydroxyacyl-CoA dehydratase [Deltaproteobacteria bacterium]MBW2324340.1 2-hydroxyacyl-CoA dehydratase [Deltaproteobacteria bacterium]